MIRIKLAQIEDVGKGMQPCGVHAVNLKVTEILLQRTILPICDLKIADLVVPACVIF